MEKLEHEYVQGFAPHWAIDLINDKLVPVITDLENHKASSQYVYHLEGCINTLEQRLAALENFSQGLDKNGHKWIRHPNGIFGFVKCAKCGIETDNYKTITDALGPCKPKECEHKPFKDGSKFQQDCCKHCGEIIKPSPTSLAEKMRHYFWSDRPLDDSMKELAQIAEQHYMETFDKAVKEYINGPFHPQQLVGLLRKNMFGKY